MKLKLVRVDGGWGWGGDRNRTTSGFYGTHFVVILMATIV